MTTCRILAERHIIPELGPRRLAALSSEDVDLWLKRKAESLSRSTLQRLLSILRRALARQVARDRLRRNVALHCEIPAGQPGRPSKALSLQCHEHSERPPVSRNVHLSTSHSANVPRNAPKHAAIVKQLVNKPAWKRPVRASAEGQVAVQGRSAKQISWHTMLEVWFVWAQLRARSSRRTTRARLGAPGTEPDSVELDDQVCAGAGSSQRTAVCRSLLALVVTQFVMRPREPGNGGGAPICSSAGLPTTTANPIPPLCSQRVRHFTATSRRYPTVTMSVGCLIPHSHDLTLLSQAYT